MTRSILDSLEKVAALSGQTLNEAMDDVMQCLDDAAEKRKQELQAKAIDIVMQYHDDWNSDPDYGDPSWEPFPDPERVLEIAQVWVSMNTGSWNEQMSMLVDFGYNGQHWCYWQHSTVSATQWEPEDEEELFLLDCVHKSIVLGQGVEVEGTKRMLWRGLTWELPRFDDYAQVV